MKESLIKKLARSSKYQILYTRAKELGNIRLFNNDIDFTKYQIHFLYWLEIYHSLYVDLALRENYIDENVIKDDLRCEAYLLLKKKLKEDKKFSKDEEEKKDKSQGNIPSVIFNRG